MLDFPSIRRAEINYLSLYGDLEVLLERAGKAVADEVGLAAKKGSKVLFLCGSGNNGADGLKAASFLKKEYDTCVIIVSSSGKVKTELAKGSLAGYDGRLEQLDKLDSEIRSADLIVDGILGTGSRISLQEPVLSAVRSINKSGKKIISIDIPTGLGSKEAVKPVTTVTFTDTKKGMNKANSGLIKVVDIGIPEDCFSRSGPGDFLYYPLPQETSHKGMNGTLAVIAGWQSFGAGVMASLSALKSGCDLVKVYLPKSSLSAFYGYSPELMLFEFDDSAVEDIRKADAVLVGPGMGKSQEQFNLMRKIIGSLSKPVVVDANTLKGMKPELLAGRNAVVTPHHGEFEIFTGYKADEKNAVKAAKAFKGVVLLKGNNDIITDGESVLTSKGGNARMTMGGTGDVLAGLVAGFIAKGMPNLYAASFASYVNKMAADLCFAEKGYWYSVTDILDRIPYVINDARLKAENR